MNWNSGRNQFEIKFNIKRKILNILFTTHFSLKLNTDDKKIVEKSASKKYFNCLELI